MSIDIQLRLERKDEKDESSIPGIIAMTPDIGEDYWSYRVIVGEHQAVLGFPKFKHNWNWICG